MREGLSLNFGPRHDDVIKNVLSIGILNSDSFSTTEKVKDIGNYFNFYLPARFSFERRDCIEGSHTFSILSASRVETFERSLLSLFKRRHFSK